MNTGRTYDQVYKPSYKAFNKKVKKTAMGYDITTKLSNGDVKVVKLHIYKDGAAKAVEIVTANGKTTHKSRYFTTDKREILGKTSISTFHQWMEQRRSLRV